MTRRPSVGDHDDVEDQGEHDDVEDHDEHDGSGPIGDLGSDPRVQAGLEHLQRAAREVIAASRAFLDVAEELVEEPGTAGGLTDLLGSLGALVGPGGLGGLADLAGRRRPAGSPAGDHDDDDPPVQRIPVS